MTAPPSFRPGELEVTGDAAGHLIGSRCADCGAHYFPVREACAGCHGVSMETIPLSGEGELYTYSIVRQSVPAFPVPYVLGYVDFPEGVRVMGQVDCPPDDVEIGMTLTLSVEPWSTEGDELGFRFRPKERP